MRVSDGQTKVDRASDDRVRDAGPGAGLRGQVPGTSDDGMCMLAAIAMTMQGWPCVRWP